jgi:hypothetical protein
MAYIRNVGGSGAGQGGAPGMFQIRPTVQTEWSTPGFIHGYETAKAAGAHPEYLRGMRNDERARIKQSLANYLANTSRSK